MIALMAFMAATPALPGALAGGVKVSWRPQALGNITSKNKVHGIPGEGTYTTLRVKGSWIVPTADCEATPNSDSNISVIIDGINGEGDAMEIGTYQNCVNGFAVYGAFLNIYPMTNYYGGGGKNISQVVIHPGDIVEAQGTWRPSDIKPINWNTNFIDETTGVRVNTDAHSPANFTPVLDSGTLIFSSDGHHTLTALSPINSGLQYTKVKASDVTGPWLGKSTFGETAALSGYNLIAWQIPGTTLGALTDSGSSFQIT